jgi:fluoroquinolone transport system permease protein
MSIYVLYGFFVVARYDTINEFLLPSVLWTFGFSFPLLYYFDILTGWWMFLHPIQAPLVILQAAFESIPVWQMVYGVGYSALWIGITLYAALRAFDRYVVRKESVRTRRQVNPAR